MSLQPRVVRETVSEDDQQIEVLTLDRPQQMNPLDHRTIVELGEALDAVVADGSSNVVVITGAGKVFSAGGDLKAYQDLYRNRVAFDSFLSDFAAVCDRLEQGPLVSIAMVNGTCVAGGLELVLSCDLTLMADDAVIADGHLRFGQLPGAGGSQRLVRAIGPTQARAWILTGGHYSAEAAMTAGVISEVVPSAQLRQRTLQLASTISAYSPLAVRHAKTLLNLAESATLADRLAAERALVGDYATTSFDATEGLIAFAERRSPKYRGN
jgi:enoyl-CoA hydratase